MRSVRYPLGPSKGIETEEVRVPLVAHKHGFEPTLHVVGLMLPDVPDIPDLRLQVAEWVPGSAERAMLAMTARIRVTAWAKHPIPLAVHVATGLPDDPKDDPRLVNHLELLFASHFKALRTEEIRGLARETIAVLMQHLR